MALKIDTDSIAVILNAIFFVFVVKRNSISIYLFSSTFSEYIKILSYIFVTEKNLNEWMHKFNAGTHFWGNILPSILLSLSTALFI